MLNDTTSGAGIALASLSKSYGSVRAVQSIDLAIAPGETVALLGPNGAGKSTTIDLVLGLTRPDSGSVSLFGLSPAQAVAQGLVGGMPQTGSLIPNLSVREIVTIVGSLYPNPLPIDEALKLSGAAQFADRPTTKVSGGQAQRVRFAIALVADPELLVRSNIALAEARADLARLAAENERIRIARDLHDLLGHSLTTITVKATLAARLGQADPARALAEIAEVESLARQALADVRAAVTSYREVTLAGELATGHELLRAAGITADLPRAADVVDTEHSELFGWVVREGLTNVVRHAHASTFGRPGYLRRAMESGASGFVVKDAPAEQLADAIRRVASGERVVDPALAAATLAAGASPLTARERDVLVAARPGATVSEIADKLFLSEGTVRNYLSAAIAKTGARNRAEAVRTADERGWL